MTQLHGGSRDLLEAPPTTRATSQDHKDVASRAQLAVQRRRWRSPSPTHAPTPNLCLGKAISPWLGFKFTATKLRGGSASGAVQIAEIRSKNCSGIALSFSQIGCTATNPGGHNPTGMGPENAIDGSYTSAWLDLNNKPLIISCPQRISKRGGLISIIVQQITFVTAADHPERDPVQWKFEARQRATGHWSQIQAESLDYNTPMYRRTRLPFFDTDCVGSGCTPAPTTWTPTTRAPTTLAPSLAPTSGTPTTAPSLPQDHPTNQCRANVSQLSTEIIQAGTIELAEVALAR